MTKFKTFILSGEDELKVINTTDKIITEDKKNSKIVGKPLNNGKTYNYINNEKISNHFGGISNKIKIKTNKMNKTSTYKTYIIENSENDNCSVDNFDIDTIDNVTYVGYGTPTNCKILRILTEDDCTYTSLWANGDELLNKIWSDRFSYQYF